MKKIMFYCQNLLGMGHLVRSTEIIRSLVKDFKVCLINGGQIVPGFEIPSAVEVINLPAVRSERVQGKGQKELRVVDSSQSIEEVKKFRKNKLLTLFDQFQPDYLITEGFPFSKHLLSFELIPLLEKVKSTECSTKVVGCIRDILLCKEEQQRAEVKEKICGWINKYFDMLLIHSDPKVHRLEESFSRVKDLNCEICYTGYVVQSPPENIAPTEEDIAEFNGKEPMIVVSVGGGRLGYNLLKTIVEAASILERTIPHRIRVFTGPFMLEEKFLELQKAANNQANITLRRYTSQLLTYMEKADLSISLCGYNTTMNILSTGVRSLVLPSDKDREQVIRGEKLEKLGLLEVIRPNDLQPERLAEKIIDSLNKESVVDASSCFELQGAKNTATLLKKKLMQIQICAA